MSQSIQRVFNVTPNHQRIFKWLLEASGSAVIVAVAGSGKTTTCVEMLKKIPRNAFVQMVAFNVTIAKELAERISEMEKEGIPLPKVNARTFHSLGFGALTKSGMLPGRNAPDTRKVKKICEMTLDAENFAMYGSFIPKLVGLAKGEGFGCPGMTPNDPNQYYRLIEHHGLQLDHEDAKIDVAITLTQRILEMSNNAARNQGILDYDDQLYLPILWNLRFWQNDYVFVDECLIGTTPILVGLDGKQMKIQDIYNQRYLGSVVTWSPEKGTHLSQITGIKRIPVGKPMIRLTTIQKDSKLSESTRRVKYGKRILVCTEDHKIWTTEGWIYAKDLKPGMTIKQETIAKADPQYQEANKHSYLGRKALSEKGDISRIKEVYIPNDYKKRGGNGRGPTRYEKLLQERLGDGWIFNYPVSCPSGFRDLGYPPAYKIDLAFPEKMIAVEVDGKSHDFRQEEDKKKDDLLTEMGWTVIRIKNEEVLSLTNEELEKRIGQCPVDSEIISVEFYFNKKYEYVYDIEVADTHCYFAHGILVHNCQDTNPIRRAIIQKILKPRGRLIAVGDPCQAIYGFTGASHDAIDLIKYQFRATELPLTVSYRCPQNVVKAAQEYVRHIQAADTTPMGEVIRGNDAEKFDITTLTNKDAILCRNTAPLVKRAYSLISAGIGCVILGRDIGQGLVSLIDQMKAKDLETLSEKLRAWEAREVQKLMKEDPDHPKIEQVQDRVGSIFALIDMLPEDRYTVKDLKLQIESMFSDNAENKMTLCTVHKAKGKEWETVVIIDFFLMPSRWAVKDWQMIQENNLIYVAFTRAKNRLVVMG